MSQRNVTYLTDAMLITCILQNGLAEEVLEAAKNAGAQGATINYARGTGVRERMGLIGVTICLLYTSPSPRDATLSRMPSSA